MYGLALLNCVHLDNASQFVGKDVAIMDEVDIYSKLGQFMGFSLRKATTDYNSALGLASMYLSYQLPALGRRCGGYTAGIDYSHVRTMAGTNLGKPMLL